MRYSADHAEKTRARIIGTAAELMRRHGPEGVGLASLMKQIGLTHGGFYAHFASKDALVAAAIEEMFRTARTPLAPRSADEPAERTLRRFVNAYLSAEHRDQPETGCPVAALASDVHRLEGEARVAFQTGFERLVAKVAKYLPGDGDATRILATSVLTEMVGALAIARAMAESEISDRLLADARASIKRRIVAAFSSAGAARA